MADYLFDKFQVAENLEKINGAISKDQMTEFIFKGLLVEQYGKLIRGIQNHSLNVISDELIKYEKEVIVKEEQTNAASGRWHRLDLAISRGHIIVIVTLVLGVLFVARANPSDDLFFPVHKGANCNCGGSGGARICTCISYLFIIF
ncbi:hypothetical protein M0R45_016447 [Rubus argutus]|uniref:Uncharacterized protein n=1 Tax=Rubus argutus TaxID=59490 RepID=A0AAW1XSR7_RUBAR